MGSTLYRQWIDLIMKSQCCTRKEALRLIDLVTGGYGSDLHAKVSQGKPPSGPAAIS